MIKKSLKSQIGIFVVIGVILVLGAIILFSYKSDVIKIFNDEKSSYKINEFIESCLDSQSEIAINKIGERGGWFYPKDNIIFAEFDKPDQFNQIAKGFDYFGIKIPYWYYYDDTSDNQNKFKTNIPEYDSEDRSSLKNQLKRYLEEHLERDCIKSFRSYEKIYDIRYEPREIKVDVVFDDEDIKLSMNLPLEINEINTNNTEFVEDFKLTLDNKLWIPYHLAKDIVNSENRDSFLEYEILEMIEPYKSKDSRDLLPPDYAYSLEYDYNPWDLRKVELLFKQIVSSNIGYTQFTNTDYIEMSIPQGLEDNEFAQAVTSMNTKDFISDTSEFINIPKIFKRYKEYRVTTSYETFFPTSFSISPSLGNIILLPKPDSVINLIPIFFTEYVASYKATLPILLEIKNTELKNDDFVFNLLIETNIDHNTALKDNIDFESLLNISEFSATEGGIEMPTKTLICDPTQFISEPISINISDPLVQGTRVCNRDRYSRANNYCNIPESGIEGAIVSFNCKGLANCFIGQTTINGESRYNNITVLNFRLPINCNPGTLTIEKFGYEKIVIENLDPNFDTPINLGNYNMSSPKKFNLSVDLVNPGISTADHSIPVGNNSGFIIFENKENPDFVKVVEISRDNQYDLDVELLPGHYNINAFLMTEDKHIIPAETKGGGGIFGKKVKLPQINLSAWMYGMLKLDNFEITTKDLLEKNKIYLHIIDFGVPTSYEELEGVSDNLDDVDELSLNHRPDIVYE